MKYAIAARVVHLFEKSQHVPTVANWIYNEFWADKGSYSSDDLAALFYRATGEDAIPLSLLALCADVPVGTVNLIEHDDENRQELTPGWRHCTCYRSIATAVSAGFWFARFSCRQRRWGLD
jgi:hypothetical protein